MSLTAVIQTRFAHRTPTNTFLPCWILDAFFLTRLCRAPNLKKRCFEYARLKGARFNLGLFPQIGVGVPSNSSNPANGTQHRLSANGTPVLSEQIAGALSDAHGCVFRGFQALVGRHPILSGQEETSAGHGEVFQINAQEKCRGELRKSEIRSVYHSLFSNLFCLWWFFSTPRSRSHVKVHENNVKDHVCRYWV